MSGTIVNPMMKQAPSYRGEAHDEYGLLMSLALDDLLDDAEERDLRAHLSICEPCQEQWLLWQRINQQFVLPPVLLPPVDLVAQVEARIAASEQRSDLRVGVLLAVLTFFIWVVGFVGVGLVLGFLIFNQIDSMNDVFHSLTYMWTTLLVILQSVGRALIGLGENRSAVGVLLGYVVLATASLAGWTQFLRRTTRPLDSQSLV